MYVSFSTIVFCTLLSSFKETLQHQNCSGTYEVALWTLSQAAVVKFFRRLRLPDLFYTLEKYLWVNKKDSDGATECQFRVCFVSGRAYSWNWDKRLSNSWSSKILDNFHSYFCLFVCFFFAKIRRSRRNKKPRITMSKWGIFRILFYRE